ncbi:MAG: SRPBCC domain-containing protein [Planctomycetota bacterium]
MTRLNAPRMLSYGLTSAVLMLPEPAWAGEITYEISEVPPGHLIVTETVIVNAPVAELWAAYTTVEGYTAWGAPVADIDLRPGGLFRASFDEDAGLEGDAVNTLRIVNFVPERVLTLKAEISPAWPEILLKDAENLYNVITFEAVDDQTSKLTSYGVGVTDSQEMRQLVSLGEQASIRRYQPLIEYLER